MRTLPCVPIPMTTSVRRSFGFTFADQFSQVRMKGAAPVTMSVDLRNERRVKCLCVVMGFLSRFPRHCAREIAARGALCAGNGAGTACRLLLHEVKLLQHG